MSEHSRIPEKTIADFIRRFCKVAGSNLVTVILYGSGPGEVLGMSAVLSGASHEVTAELLDNSQVAFVRHKDVLRFLRMHRDASLRVLYLVSENLHSAYERVQEDLRNNGHSEQSASTTLPA